MANGLMNAQKSFILGSFEYVLERLVLYITTFLVVGVNSYLITTNIYNLEFGMLMPHIWTFQTINDCWGLKGPLACYRT